MLVSADSMALLMASQCIRPRRRLCDLGRLLLDHSRLYQAVSYSPFPIVTPILTLTAEPSGLLALFRSSWALVRPLSTSHDTTICFISWIPRIAFSVLMLQTVIDVSKNYGHVFIASKIRSLIATAFGAWFSVTLVAIYAKYYPGNPACDIGGAGGCSKAKVIDRIVFVTFAAYWITGVIKNVMHVNISRVYGSWYFCAQKPPGVPKGATRGAFKRSMTYSFGSISFGS